MMRARVITDAAGLAALAPDWNRLWLLQPRAEVFTHHAWARTFVEAYGCGQGLQCIVVEAEGVVCGVLPLFADAKHALRFIGDPRSDYSDVLCAPDDVDAVVKHALGAVDDLHRLRLHAVPEHALMLRALRTGVKHKLTIREEEPCPAIVFDGAGEVARAVLKKESLRRHEKKLGKLGAIALTRITTQAEALRMLPAFFEQHVRRWSTTTSRSLFEQPENRRFYERLVEDQDMWPMVDFRVLYAGEKMVAAHFGFLHAGRFIWYKPTFDAELSAMGPGEVLLKQLIAAAVAEGAHEFDFTRGNEGFKQRFATVTRQNYEVCCPTLMQRARRMAGRVRDAIKQRAKKP